MIINHFSIILTIRFQSPQLGLNVDNSVLHLTILLLGIGLERTIRLITCPETHWIMSVRSSNMAEEYVNFITEHSVPVALFLQEIEKATLNHKVLQEVIKCMASDNWQNPKVSLELKDFFSMRHEVSVARDYDVLLRGCRIIIPYVLRHKAIQLAHEGHQGVVKTKSLFRSKIWYPGIDRDIEKLVSSCIPCQANIVENKPVHLHMSPTPARPWSVLNIDFCGRSQGGIYVIIVYLLTQYELSCILIGSLDLYYQLILPFHSVMVHSQGR